MDLVVATRSSLKKGFQTIDWFLIAIDDYYYFVKAYNKEAGATS
jgi:hypothetical protein